MNAVAYALSMLPSVWSCFTTLTVAAFGILVSSVISTLRSLLETASNELD